MDVSFWTIILFVLASPVIAIVLCVVLYFAFLSAVMAFAFCVMAVVDGFDRVSSAYRSIAKRVQRKPEHHSND